jgi:branched-chain amino acid transport system ATP-binding protein
MTMFLEVLTINTFYNVFQAIFDVSLSLRKGEVVCLLGRNGAGKTTTLNSIVGLLKPRSGSIKLKGREIVGTESYKIARMGVGIVPENRLIFSDLTVRENLELACRDMNRKRRQDKIARIYDLYPRLEQLSSRFGGYLSGGEQQMLAIARSLMTDPELLLLDELTTGLAPIVIQSFKQQLKTLKEEKLTILLTEQNTLFALDLSDRAYVIDKGAIVFEGTVEHLRRQDEVMRRYLGV